MPYDGAAPLSIEAFRAWVSSRPDEEHWELIAGVATKKAPATKACRRITSNLEWRLNDALKAHRAELTAYQRVGLNLAPLAPDYDPEPDVVVVDVDSDDDDRYSDRFYLVGEIVSATNRDTIDRKRHVYKLHPDCRCILLIAEDRLDVEVMGWDDSVWRVQRLTDPNDHLILEAFGLRCTLADLYRGTALQPRGRG